MKNLQLHNLKAYIKWHPNATVSDYAKDARERRCQMETLNKWIEQETRRKQ